MRISWSCFVYSRQAFAYVLGDHIVDVAYAHVDASPRVDESRALIAPKHGKDIIGGRLRVGLLLQSLTFVNISKRKLRSPICDFRRTKKPSPKKTTRTRRSILLKFHLYSSVYF